MKERHAHAGTTREHADVCQLAEDALMAVGESRATVTKSLLMVQHIQKELEQALAVLAPLDRTVSASAQKVGFAYSRPELRQPSSPRTNVA